jgi:hypothetical protein
MAGDWWNSLLLHKVHCIAVVSENEVRIQVYQFCSTNKDLIAQYKKNKKNITI